MIVAFGAVGFTMSTVPPGGADKSVHSPFPVVGVLPSRLVVRPHTLLSRPASGSVGFPPKSTKISSLLTQLPFVTVQRVRYAPGWENVHVVIGSLAVKVGAGAVTGDTEMNDH